YSGSGASAITINGNVQSFGTGAGSAPDLILTAGTGGIQILGARTFTNDGTNARSIDLESNASITGNLTLERPLQMGLAANRTLTAGTNNVIHGDGDGYVIGTIKLTFTAAASKSYAVGTVNGYSPVTVNITSGTFDSDFSVKANQGAMYGVPGLNKLARYWTLTGSPFPTTADLTF